MVDTHLYFEPTLYMPYELSLCNRNAITLTEMWVENGQKVEVEKLFKKFVRMPNRHFLKAQFRKPLFMQISELVGTENIITLNMQYEINCLSEQVIKVFHKQNLNFQPSNRHHKVINQYTSSMALPAMFGTEGVSLAKEKETFQTNQTVLQIGLLEEDMTRSTWCIETLDRLYPNTDLKHGVIH